MRESRAIRYQALPFFQRATLKHWEWPGDEATPTGLQFFLLQMSTLGLVESISAVIDTPARGIFHITTALFLYDRTSAT